MTGGGSGKCLRFSEPLFPERLPRNYLPAAFRELQGPSGQKYGLIDQSGAARAQNPDAWVIEAETLADPLKTADHVREMGVEDVALGPALRPDSSPGERSEAPRLVGAAGEKRVLGIIDAGLAFWNRSFLGDKKNFFRDVGFLSLVPDATGRPAIRFLSGEFGADFIDQTIEKTFENQIVEKFSHAFPESVFGEHPIARRLFRQGGFNHATAMADLAHRCDGGGNFDAGFAIELPSAALIDASGGTVRIGLHLALRALLGRVVDWANAEGCAPKIEVLLPVAFTGAPEPFAPDLAALCGEFGLAPGAVTLHLPMGNHRQDSLVAVLDGSEQRPLGWWLSSDDHGENTIEMTSGGVGTLVLISPEGEECRADLTAGFRYLFDGKDIIGALWSEDRAGALVSRLTLAPTASGQSARPTCSPGEWGIKINGLDPEKDRVSLWILRKDRIAGDRFVPPFRQSHFRHAAYQKTNTDGSAPLDDATGGGPIRRRGTASALVGAGGVGIHAVQALRQVPVSLGRGFQTAHYGGAFADPAEDIREARQVVGQAGSHGLWVLGNGGPRQFKLAGTSVAAALNAARSARGG